MGGLFGELVVESAGEAERVFDTLKDHGAVMMPLCETFWAERFGMLTDPFGVPWMISCLNECGNAD